MTQGIYKIVDVNGKTYIGSAVNIEKRWDKHEYDLNRNNHCNIHLQRAWNKYGAQYFTFSIVEIVEDSYDLVLQEQKYLDLLFQNYESSEFYNICSVAGSLLGYKHTDESRAKNSLLRTGNTNALGHELTSGHKAKVVVAHAKTYILLSPDGILTEIYNMEKFCRDNGLHRGNMCSVAYGNRKSAHGWTNPFYNM